MHTCTHMHKHKQNTQNKQQQTKTEPPLMVHTVRRSQGNPNCTSESKNEECLTAPESLWEMLTSEPWSGISFAGLGGAETLVSPAHSVDSFWGKSECPQALDLHPFLLGKACSPPKVILAVLRCVPRFSPVSIYLHVPVGIWACVFTGKLLLLSVSPICGVDGISAALNSFCINNHLIFHTQYSILIFLFYLTPHSHFHFFHVDFGFPQSNFPCKLNARCILAHRLLSVFLSVPVFLSVTTNLWLSPIP